MSNKNIPNTEPVSTLNSDASVLNGTKSSTLKSSPLFGWLYAGSDLLSAKLDHAAGVVSQKIDETHETINAMQVKGLEVEGELRRTLNPFAIVDTAQKLVTSTPLFSLLSGGQKRQQKEHQLEVLNAKVDLLVEQVALLAAKEAAQKAAEASKTAEKNAANKAKAGDPEAKGAATKEDVKPAVKRTTATRTRKASTAKTNAQSAASKTSSATKQSTASKAGQSASTKTSTRKTSTAKASAVKDDSGSSAKTSTSNKKDD
ncbi:hypothetical protein [Alteromonas gracilis]|uniref:hypothetical protein n=1 Tax=Alteromonas gracilis TaxID=1479524 RepID=UPI00373586E2